MTRSAPSPLRVLVKRHRHHERQWAPLWEWYCPGCDQHQVSFSDGPDLAMLYGRRHSCACPALRLARLEAELEKLADAFDWSAENAANDDGDPCWRGRSSDYRLSALWLTQILARHREATR